MTPPARDQQQIYTSDLKRIETENRANLLHYENTIDSRELEVKDHNASLLRKLERTKDELEMTIKVGTLLQHVYCIPTIAYFYLPLPTTTYHYCLPSSTPTSYYHCLPPPTFTYLYLPLPPPITTYPNLPLPLLLTSTYP